MTGIKSLREKNKGIFEALDERRARGEEPIGKPAPTTPMEARTAPGRMFGLQNQIQEAEDRATRAETELAQLRATMAEGGAPVDTKALAEAELRRQEAETALADAQAKLDDALKGQVPRTARLEQLVEIPGRRRKLTDEQYDELRENLRHNKLTHPITVRSLPDGRYEVISGYNRISVYRDLGRAEIEMYVLDLTEEESEGAALYANLLAPTLPAYECYIGFKAIMARKGFTTGEQLAEDAGVSTAKISKALSLGELPANALQMISEQPALYGTETAHKLVTLCKKGKAQQALTAIQAIAAGTTPAVAIREATASSTNSNKAKAITIRQGKHKYCEIIRADKSVRLSFTSAEEAEAIMSAIKTVVEQRAKANKTGA